MYGVGAVVSFWGGLCGVGAAVSLAMLYCVGAAVVSFWGELFGVGAAVVLFWGVSFCVGAAVWGESFGVGGAVVSFVAKGPTGESVHAP